VKHFKFIHRGKRRLHQKPVIRQVISCRPWLQAELGIIRPKVVVCLGATAAQSLLSRIVQVTKERGQFLDGTLEPPSLSLSTFQSTGYAVKASDERNTGTLWTT
jgi:DNA polymerase